MLKPALFLDRDGTLIKDKNYLKSPDQIEFIDSVIPALQRAMKWGWHLIVISNQSGVARGYFDECDVRLVHIALQKMLEHKKIYLSGIYYCPHYLDGNPPYNIYCNCRKPEPGMLRTAAFEHNIDLDKSVVIGDKLSDVETAHRLKLPGILVKSGYGVEELKKADKTKPDYVAGNLLKAIQWIEQRFDLSPQK